MNTHINRCLLYSGDKGFPVPRANRYFTLVDGVIAGDSDGPAPPNRFGAGVLVGKFNPVAVDCETARLMRLEPLKIPMLAEAFAYSELPLAPSAYSAITIQSKQPQWQGRLEELHCADTYHFQPHFSWRGKFESPTVAVQGGPRSIKKAKT